MNHWIDDVSRAAAAGLSRRQVLRRISGVVAGGVLATLLPRQVQAQQGLGVCSDYCRGRGLSGEALNECMRACRACEGDLSKLCAKENNSPGPETVCCPTVNACIIPGICKPSAGGTCPTGTTDCGTFGCCARGTVCMSGGCVPGGSPAA